MARQQVARTQAEADGVLSARRAAAQRRAAAEQVARVEEALAQLPDVEAAKARNRSRSAAKVSLTDPDARVMKLMDGGFRPAYNVQFATDVDSQAIVGVAVTNEGADSRQLPPMLAQVAARTGRDPAAALADGGYVSIEAIQAAAARDVTLYMPIPKSRNAPGAGTTRAPDSAVAAWRARMATADAQTVYKTRAGTAERINADGRTHRTLAAVAVRGLTKVHTWVLWVALATNVMRAMDIIPHQMM
jgi:hypothetical protein